MNIIRSAKITHTLIQGFFSMRGAYSSSSLFILGCFDAKGAGAGAQQGRRRSNDWQGRYHPQTCCTLTSNSLLFPTMYLDYHSSLLLKKWYLPICPSFQGVSWRRRTLPQSKTRSVPISSQHSKCVLHPLAYHQIWYIPSNLFLFFVNRQVRRWRRKLWRTIASMLKNGSTSTTYRWQLIAISWRIWQLIKFSMQIHFPYFYMCFGDFILESRNPFVWGGVPRKCRHCGEDLWFKLQRQGEEFTQYIYIFFLGGGGGLKIF